MTTETTIKTQVCETIFQNGYPENINGKHPFDYFIEAEVESSGDIESCELGNAGFDVACEYEFENVRSLRGLMQSMYNDLEQFANKLLKTRVLQLNKDECINDNVFYELVEEGKGTLHRKGTPEEYAHFVVFDREA